MSSEVIKEWRSLVEELKAEALTREDWLSLVDRAETLAEGPGGLPDMLSPFIFVGDRRGWEHPNHR